jgi:hypothetical protein
VVIPAAAAAAVAGIALGAAIVVPRILPGPPSRAPQHGLAALAYPGGRVPAGPPPRFIVAILFHPTHGNPNGTDLEIVSSATGRGVGRILAPARGQTFQAVAALGSDSTFLLAATPSSSHRCGTWLYQLRLAASGRPASLSPFVVPFLNGGLGGLGGPAALAASADGHTVAFDVAKCPKPRFSSGGQVGVIRVPSGRITRWTYVFPAAPYSLSLSADGGLLGMVSNPSNAGSESAPELNRFYLLGTDSAPGPLALRYRTVVGSGAQSWPQTAALAPTGAVGYVGTARYVGKATYRLTIAAYRTGSGRLVRVLHQFGRHQGFNGIMGFTAETSGRYLLLHQWTHRLEVVDAATGLARSVPGNETDWLDFAW